MKEAYTDQYLSLINLNLGTKLMILVRWQYLFEHVQGGKILSQRMSKWTAHVGLSPSINGNIMSNHVNTTDPITYLSVGGAPRVI